jgi:hypothetical protein
MKMEPNKALQTMKRIPILILSIVISIGAFLLGARWQFERRNAYDEQKAKEIYGWSDADIIELKTKLREFGVTPDQMATFGRDVQLLVKHHGQQTEYDQTLTAAYALSVYLSAKDADLDKIKQASLTRLRSFVATEPVPVSDPKNRERVIQKITELSANDPALAELVNKK